MSEPEAITTESVLLRLELRMREILHMFHHKDKDAKRTELLRFHSEILNTIRFMDGLKILNNTSRPCWIDRYDEE